MQRGGLRVSVSNQQVGGFQGGFSARVVRRTECRFPDYLICSHGCEQVIQLVSHVSGEVEFELCPLEAERFARVLLGASAFALGEAE
jgi:hypothetical protein